jgi:hypothetical protein
MIKFWLSYVVLHYYKNKKNTNEYTSAHLFTSTSKTKNYFESSVFNALKH